MLFSPCFFMTSLVINSCYWELASRRSCKLNFYFPNLSSERFINYWKNQPSSTCIFIIFWSTALLCFVIAALRFVIFLFAQWFAEGIAYTAPEESYFASHDIANYISLISHSSLNLLPLSIRSFPTFGRIGWLKTHT